MRPVSPLLPLFGTLAFGCAHHGGSPPLPQVQVTTDAPVVEHRDLGNPFGVFYAADHGEAVHDLGAASRIIVLQWVFEERLDQLDQVVTENSGRDLDVVVSLVFDVEERRIGSDPTGNERYCLPTGDEHARALAFASRLVERYDGDDDFGCHLDAPDCYQAGDGAWPSAALQAAVQDSPIHAWQVENELLLQVRDCSTDPDGVNISGPEAVGWVGEVAAVIREADPSAVVVSPALTYVGRILLLEGYLDALSFGADDCGYLHVTRDEILASDALTEDIVSETEFFAETVRDLVAAGGSVYDVLDFHSYDNDYRRSEALHRWLEDEGAGDLPVMATELAGPFYFFPLIGADRPTDCSGTDRGPERYSAEIHAAHVVKNSVIALHAGVSQVFWATLVELFDPYPDNYKRLALLDSGGAPGPAYHTFALMREKLADPETIQRVHDDVYRFTFADRPPVLVGWADDGGLLLDTSPILGEDEVTVTHLVTDPDATRPVTEQAPSEAVPISQTPVFIEQGG